MRITRAGTSSASLLSAVFTLTLLGCGGGMSAADPPVTTITSTQNPLVAQYSVSSGCLGEAMAEFGADQSYGRSTPWYQVPGHYSATKFLIAGMKASTTYHMRLVFNCFGKL